MNYKIEGDEMPVVICELENGEKMITESGSMSWMTPNMEMETSAGGLGKAFGKLFTGENIFQNIYTAKGGKGMIAFSSSFPGKIVAMEITPDKPIIAQKRAFLAATEGIELSVFFQKKAVSGFFGGEGFLMQKISGSGIAFFEIDGSSVSYNLAAGQKLVISTGNLALCDSTCSIDTQTVKGVKNVLFGGEGIFNTVVTGPGQVTLQTMPFSNLVGQISACLPSKN